MSRAWRTFALVGTGSIVLYFALHIAGAGGTALAVVYDLLGIAAVAAIVAGARRAGGRSRKPLMVVAAGNALFVGGDVVWDVYDIVFGLDPFPSAADGLYLSGFVVLGAGLFMMVRRRTPGGERAGALDAGIVTAGAALLSWIFLIRPHVVDASLDGVATGISIAYPLGDLLLLGLAVRLAMGGGRRNGALRLMIAALVCSLTADSVFGYLSLTGDYPAGHWGDAGWLAAYVLWGAAALHPGAGRVSGQAEERGAIVSRGRLSFLAAAALLAPAALLVQWLVSGHVDVAILALGWGTILALVFLRIGGMASQLERSRREREMLLDRILRAEEEERTRIAVELHDGPIQRLTVLGLGLEKARILMDRDGEEPAPVLDGLRDALVRETDELRHMMSGLRPPALDEQGIEAALQGQAAALADETGLASTVDATVTKPISADLQAVVFRVAQEALTNVAKHARARSVQVRLSATNGRVDLRVIDDGVGFDPGRVFIEEGHFGLRAMRERARMAGGTLHVSSRPGRGTMVEMSVPNDEAGS